MLDEICQTGADQLMMLDRAFKLGSGERTYGLWLLLQISIRNIEQNREGEPCMFKSPLAPLWCSVTHLQ